MIQKILSYFNIQTELDNFDTIHDSIQRDSIFKGTNLWILAFAIIVASVGLNMNSTAVIIGAMLISPLMGPINAMGYSIATYNFTLFRLSIKNFSFAVVASLVASTAYFAISPVSTAHSELLARTSPTIYDVLIAFFGGLAGIVAISSKQKGNVIPGVAIATALMPPLCTAGYGIATAQLSFFLGAMYLFTINTVFIALASVIVSQYLKFPIRTLVNSRRKKTVNSWITAILVITLLPSVYFGYVLVKQEKFFEKASTFVKEVSVYEGNYLMDHSIDKSKTTLRLVFAGKSLLPEQLINLKNKANNWGLDSSLISIQEGLNFEKFTSKEEESLALLAEIASLKQIVQQKNDSLDNYRLQNELGKVILTELNALFPGVSACYIAQNNVFTFKKQDNQTLYVVEVFSANKLDEQEQNKITSWLSVRLNSDKIKVHFEKD